jgi:hypothetical protein
MTVLIPTPRSVIFFKINTSNSEVLHKERFKMATVIRPEISEKNKYWISKHRHYELKHFCLQYPMWKKAYATFSNAISSSSTERLPSSNVHGDPTARSAVNKLYYLERIELIEKAAMDADKELYTYILKAVTEELSYTYLKTKLKIPCGRDMYYDRYRRFFWLLSHSRN